MLKLLFYGQIITQPVLEAAESVRPRCCKKLTCWRMEEEEDSATMGKTPTQFGYCCHIFSVGNAVSPQLFLGLIHCI